MEGLKGAPLRIFVIAKEPWLLGPSKFLIFPKPIWANAVIFLFLLNFYFPKFWNPEILKSEIADFLHVTSKYTK